MSIYRAFIVDDSNPEAVSEFQSALLRADAFGMISSVKEEVGSRRAIFLYDQRQDRNVTFQEVASLVNEHGNQKVSKNAFRGLFGHRQWPADFASVDLG